MLLTNFVINSQKPLAKNNINKSFNSGLKLEQENYIIQENLAKVNLEKAHVKSHTRATKSGKIVQVRDYENKRTKQLKFSLASKENFYKFLEKYDSTPESQIKKNLGEFVESPGNYQKEKNNYKNIEDYMIKKLGKENFSKLEELYFKNKDNTMDFMGWKKKDNKEENNNPA
jgi:hypothetical protein